MHSSLLSRHLGRRRLPRFRGFAVPLPCLADRLGGPGSDGKAASGHPDPGTVSRNQLDGIRLRPWRLPEGPREDGDSLKAPPGRNRTAASRKEELAPWFLTPTRVRRGALKPLGGNPAMLFSVCQTHNSPFFDFAFPERLMEIDGHFS